MEYLVIPILGKILKDRNMTQTQLSNLTGIPQGTISKFDRNKQHQDVHLIAISKALDLTIEELFEVRSIDGNVIDMNQKVDIVYEPGKESHLSYAAESSTEYKLPSKNDK